MYTKHPSMGPNCKANKNKNMTNANEGARSYRIIIQLPIYVIRFSRKFKVTILVYKKREPVLIVRCGNTPVNAIWDRVIRN